MSTSFALPLHALLDALLASIPPLLIAAASRQLAGPVAVHARPAQPSGVEFRSSELAIRRQF